MGGAREEGARSQEAVGGRKSVGTLERCLACICLARFGGKLAEKFPGFRKSDELKAGNV